MNRLVSRIICRVVLILRPAFLAVDLLHQALGEVLIASATDEDWDWFNLHLYRRCVQFGSPSLKRGLARWEKSAIETFFPKPPAHILVCAAGSGREMVELARLGYKVSGLEPVEDFMLRAREAVPKDSLINMACGTFADLCHGKVEVLQGPYDGVIIGWGGFAHIASEEAQKMLLQHLLTKAPKGVVLLSSIRVFPVGPFRMKLINALGKIFKVRPPVGKTVYDYRVGLSRGIEREGLGDVAAQSGYRVLLFDDLGRTPYAVLQPV
jgi:hypothetical protein